MNLKNKYLSCICNVHNDQSPMPIVGYLWQPHGFDPCRFWWWYLHDSGPCPCGHDGVLLYILLYIYYWKVDYFFVFVVTRTVTFPNKAGHAMGTLLMHYVILHIGVGTTFNYLNVQASASGLEKVDNSGLPYSTKPFKCMHSTYRSTM